ncbi:hypothetical protein [Flavobacterium sp. J27]|uniref:hypothetical protein n=1 Tax=Flavobacterium sp. J27 TaxID=2060419 RepID=UPI0010307795|nr:hypothetical protein [Flavobacterium sp. J27]
MSKGFYLKMEEYVPAGAFLKASFVRDREELATRFSEFTTAYLQDFEVQLAKVAGLEQTLVLTEEQKGVTVSLYTTSEVANKELNFLSFYFERANLDPAIISAVKKDLAVKNIEGAVLKLDAVIQYVLSKKTLLESKGMSAAFPDELTTLKEDLKAKNELQNVVMNVKKQLYKDNKQEYDALYAYISVIAKAGKIMYDGLSKRDEYTVTKITSRMRRVKKNTMSEPEVVD